MKSVTRPGPQSETASQTVIAHQLEDDGRIPNNPKLPLLIYERAFDPGSLRQGAAVEDALMKNGWRGLWRNGIYNFHHYHSTAHEVLAVYSGSATVQLGGESGIVRTLHTGDVVIIPAGVGHKNLESSPDFKVIGGYPAGQDWDMCYGKPTERPRADHNIAQVPLPRADPVYGDDGPLLQYWHRRGHPGRR